MATTQHVTTAEELLQASGLGRCELVRGELHMMSPAGFEHGRIAEQGTHDELIAAEGRYFQLYSDWTSRAAA